MSNKDGNSNMDGYDIDLRSSGDGWRGTYYNAVQSLVNDITDNGPYGPVEVTKDSGTVFTGTLDVWMGEGTFTITEPDNLPQIVEIDDVVRVRA